MSALNRTKYLNDVEVSTLMSNLRLDNRDDVILLLAIETGARASEILQITVSDLFPESETILIHGLKGSKDRELPVRPDLFRAAQRFIPFNIGYKRLFQIWDMKRKSSNIKKKFHSLRHTFALQIYKRTVNLQLVQVALGHTSISNTMIYLDYVYTTEELRKILPSAIESAKVI